MNVGRAAAEAWREEILSGVALEDPLFGTSWAEQRVSRDRPLAVKDRPRRGDRHGNAIQERLGRICNKKHIIYPESLLLRHIFLL